MDNPDIDFLWFDKFCVISHSDKYFFTNMDYRLPKSAKLRHRTLVNHLFHDGRSIYAYPIRLMYAEMSKDELSDMFCNEVPACIENVQFMITVPKKKQRRAVDRVLLRRRIREAFRLSRHGLEASMQSDKERYISLAFVYLSDTIYDYKSISEKMCLLLSKLAVQINDSKNSDKE